MSNFHYYEQKSTKCENDYAALQNLEKTQPLPACLDRDNCERSVKDIMYYNWFVLDEPMVLPSAQPKQKINLSNR